MSLKSPIEQKHSKSVIPPLSRVSLEQRLKDEGLISRTDSEESKKGESQSEKVEAGAKKEYYLDKKGQLRARMVEDVPKAPDYFSEGKGYYIVSDGLPNLLTPEEVCGMLGFNRKHFMRSVLSVFHKMGATSRWGLKSWRIATWAVLRLSNYQGRCANCGRPWEDYIERTFRERGTRILHGGDQDPSSDRGEDCS